MTVGLLRLCVAFALLGSLFAAPLQQRKDWNPCSYACSYDYAEQKGFLPGKSYRFQYEGKSDVVVEGVTPPASSSLELKAEVILTVGQTCDMEIQIKNPQVNGQTDSILQRELTEKRMLARYQDGVIPTVCSDPEEYPSGLNLKKGILSTIQNSLTTLRGPETSVSLLEIDILGRCPTEYIKYNRNGDNDKEYLVIKKKNHKDCTEQFTTADESPVTSWWLRSSSLSLINESRSECHQVYDQQNEQLKEARCKDVKYVRAGERVVKTTQDNKLKLLSSEDGQISLLDKTRVTDLRFEVVPKVRTDDVLPAIKKHLKELCSSVEPRVKKDAATHVQALISALKNAPKEKIKELLDEIKKGEFCQDSTRLESIYLDIMPYVDNAGAVEVMVEEVTSGRISDGQTPLYTLALHLIKKPCIDSVKAVRPLFDMKSKKATPAMILAAGNLVRKYCRFHQDCLKDDPVKEILQKLSEKVDSSCSSSKDDQEKKIEVLTALKALGNIANISSQTEKSVLRCLESRDADTYVRVAAAQAYRQVSCQAQPTEDLVILAIRSSEDTEVRVASYIAAIRCANYEQANRILSYIEREHNTQVRAFVLSHLRNLQKSDAPYLLGLRYKLSSLLIPTDFEKDLKKYSRDIDMSYYLPVLGLGFGVETGVLYNPGSYVPRQVQTNLTLDLFDSVINVGEFAVRLEDFDAIMNMLVESSQSESVREFNEIFKTIRRGGPKTREQDRYSRRSGRQSEFSSLNNILSAFDQEGKSKRPRIDVLSRIFGQEVAFASSHLDSSEMSSERILKQIFDFIDKILVDLANEERTTARAGQVRICDYLVPTAQGIPLQLKVLVTGVMALDSDAQNPENKVKLSPTASLALNAFVGYTFGAKTGIRARGQAYLDPQSKLTVKLSKNDVEVVLDIPKEVKILDASYSSYTMTKMPAQEDQRKDPQQGSYPTWTFDKCYQAKDSLLGVEECIHIMSPDYKKDPMAPLGDAQIEITLKKEKQNNELLKFSMQAQLEEHIKSLDIKLEAPAANDPIKAELTMEYQTNSDTQSVMMYGKVQNTKGRSIRISMKKKETSSGSLQNIVVFSGDKRQLSSADQIMAVKMKEGKKENRKEFSLSTMKSLKKHVDANIEVDLVEDDHLLEIRKLEAHLRIPQRFNSTSYVRLERFESHKRQYSVYSLTEIPSGQVLKVMGQYEAETMPEISVYNYQSKFLIMVREEKYDLQTKILRSPVEHELSGTLKHPDRTEPIAHLKLESRLRLGSDSDSSESYKAVAELEIPSLIPSYAAHLRAKSLAPNKYEVEGEAKVNEEQVLKISGPVFTELKEFSFKQRSELKLVSTRDSTEYLLKSKLELSPDQVDSLVNLKINGKLAVAAEFEQNSEDSVATSTVSLVLPETVDAKFKVERTSSSLQMVVNGYLEPNTQFSKKIQGSSSILLDRKEVKGKLAYDLERDPSKKVELDAKYDFNIERRYVSVKGDLDLKDNKYRYAAEAILGSYSRDPDNKNSVKIRVTHPDGKEMIFESECSYKRELPLNRLKYLIMLQNGRDEIHRMDSNYGYDFSQAPRVMKLVGETKLESPSSKEIVISIDTELAVNQMGQKGHGKFEIKGERLPEPIHTSIEFNNEEKQLKAKAKMDLGSSSRLRINGNTQMTKDEQRFIRDASMDLAIDLAKDRSYKVKALKSVQKIVLDISVDQKQILVLEQESAEPDLWSARLTTPDRRTEIESRRTIDSVSLSLYPNRKESEDKYEVEGHYRQSRSLWKSDIDADAQLRIPGLQKSIRIRSNDNAIGGRTSHGHVELDIFQRPEDKVTIEVRSVVTEGGSHRINATVKVPRQDNEPRFHVEFHSSNDSKRLGVQIRKSEDQDPSFVYKFEANKLTERSWLVYSQLKTPSDDIELLSELRRHQLLQCMGRTLNGTVTSKKLGAFDFKSAVCMPGYIEIGAKQISQDKIYMAKLGMKRPNAVKLAVDLVYNSSDAITTQNARDMETTFNLYGKHEYLPKQNVLLVGAKLWSPSVVSIDAYYNKHRYQEYMQELVNPAKEKLQHLYDDVLKPIPKEIKERMLPQLPEVATELSEEVRHLKEKVSEELRVMIKDMGITSENLEELRQSVVEAVKKIGHECKRICEEMDRVLKRTIGYSIEEIEEKLREVEQGIASELIRILRETVKFIEEMIEDPKSVMERPAVKWISKQLVGNSIWDWFKDKFHHLKQKFDREWREVKHFVRHYSQIIKDDIKRIYNKVMNISAVKRFVKWIESWFENDRDLQSRESSFVRSFVRQFYTLCMIQEEQLFRLQFPLISPVASLSAAVRSVGLSLPRKQSLKRISKPSEVADTFIRSQEPQAKVEEVLVTFDGLVVPIIFSECEILIAKVFDDKLTAKFPSNSKMDLKIQSKSGQQVKIHLEAGKPPQTEMLKDRESVKLPGMELKKVSEWMIEVDLKGMKIIMGENLINVIPKPSSFAKIEGLMGNHDNEKGNDAHQEAESVYSSHWQGSQHRLTKKAARELMEKYRVLNTCAIPQQ